MRRNIVPLAAVTLANDPNGRIGADHERAIADGRRLHNCRRRELGGRRREHIPAERQRAGRLLCHREARFCSRRHAILQTGQIAERFGSAQAALRAKERMPAFTAFALAFG
jgi:hypothetical protein